MKILLVDDEPLLREQLGEILIRQKYSVDTAANGDKALECIAGQPYDLIILDIMMPGRDGFAVLREIRRDRIKTPVLMLTARSGIDDRVKGLDQGADDYLAKPFSTDELLARVRALLRRDSEHVTAMLSIGAIRLNTVTREVTCGGVPVLLTPKEFSLLEFLLYNKNRVISRFSLAEHVWGDDFDPFTMSNYIDVHVKNLRRKIGDETAVILRTVRGVGYVIRDGE